MNEKQKNKSMVNAFGTGKPPVATVRRRGETKQQQRARGQGVDPNSDISDIFSWMQQMRSKVNKGMSGMPLNPDGTDPGNSFDRFMRQNPHLQGAAQRQAQYDQQARENWRENLRSIIAERKALQEMQNQNPNLAVGADGYRTLFDGQGKVIGTTKPLQSTAMWKKDDAINRGTASPGERQDFANALQNTGMSSMASEIQGPKLPANMSTLFPGKSSPPGGGQGDRVGSLNPSGEPGGETIMGQMPNVQGEGMLMGTPTPALRRPGVQFGPGGGQRNPTALNALGVPNVPGIQYGARKPVEQSGWDALFPGKQASMAPNDGPQVPPISPQQLEALKALDTRGYPARAAKELPQAPGRIRMGLTNYFPGNDYDYLQQLFPGQSIDQILQMFPTYANQFR